MINRPFDLSCKVLYNKYGRNTDLRVSINVKPYDSPSLKTLARIMDQIRNYTVWQVGNEQQVKFRLDKGMTDGHSVMNHSNQQVIDTILIVKDT
jgi:hypothetical protein